MKTLEEYYNAYNRMEDLYWDLEDASTSFLKWASSKFTNNEIKNFLNSISKWNRHCLTEKRGKNWLYNYRGFNVHFYYFKPLEKYSQGCFYIKDEDYFVMPHMNHLCIITFTKLEQTNPYRGVNVFKKEFVTSIHIKDSWRHKKAVVDRYIMKYKHDLI